MGSTTSAEDANMGVGASSAPTKHYEEVPVAELPTYAKQLAAKLSQGSEEAHREIILFLLQPEQLESAARGEIARHHNKAYRIQSSQTQAHDVFISLVIERNNETYRLSYESKVTTYDLPEPNAFLLDSAPNGKTPSRPAFTGILGAVSAEEGGHVPQSRPIPTSLAQLGEGLQKAAASADRDETRSQGSANIPTQDPLAGSGSQAGSQSGSQSGPNQIVEVKRQTKLPKTKIRKPLPAWEQVHDEVGGIPASAQIGTDHDEDEWNPFLDLAATRDREKRYLYPQGKDGEREIVSYADYEKKAREKSGYFGKAGHKLEDWDKLEIACEVNREELEGPETRTLGSWEDEVLKLNIYEHLNRANATRPKPPDGDFPAEDELHLADQFGYGEDTANASAPPKSPFERMLEDANFYEVPCKYRKGWEWYGGDFYCSGDGLLRVDHPTLNWTGKGRDNAQVGEAVAICEDMELKFANFDCEVELKIPTGHAGGLVARALNESNYCTIRLDTLKKDISFVEYNDIRRWMQKRVESHEKGPGYLLFRFVPLKMRGTDRKRETVVQLGRFELGRHGRQITPTNGGTAFNPGGGGNGTGQYKANGPDKILDESTTTVWYASLAPAASAKAALGVNDHGPVKLDCNRAAVVMQFDHRVDATQFRFTTPRDHDSRDPIQWVVQGSNDGLQWTPLHSQAIDYKPVSGTHTVWFDFQPAVYPREPEKLNILNSLVGEKTMNWYRLRLRAIGPQVAVYFNQELALTCLDTSNRSGSFGVWCSYSRDRMKGDRPVHHTEAGEDKSIQPSVEFRDFGIVSLEDTYSQITMQQWNLMTEQYATERNRKRKEVDYSRTMRATRLIQEIAHIKLRYIDQRMMLYEQAKRDGKDVKIKEKKLLTWLALLSVMEKFDKKLRQEEWTKLKHEKFLKQLQQDMPPPPPPPAQPPPKAADEDLHYKYEEMKMKYEKEWIDAGRILLGEEKFKERVLGETGPAQKEKGEISKKWLDRAMTVMSEKEHQEYIRKAWCLENDWKSIDDVDPKEIAAWAREKGMDAHHGKNTEQKATSRR